MKQNCSNYIDHCNVIWKVKVMKKTGSYMLEDERERRKKGRKSRQAIWND